MTIQWRRKRNEPVPVNELVTGTTGCGKSEYAARKAKEWDGALILCDPHRDSLARRTLTHVPGEVLYERLSDVRHTLGWSFLEPSQHKNVDVRDAENDFRAGVFAEMLIGPEGLNQPLKEEWLTNISQLFLNQDKWWPLKALPDALNPAAPNFDCILEHCTKEEVAKRFEALRQFTPRGLRFEVGSTRRLLEKVCNSQALVVRDRGGFAFEEFLQKKGKLIIERGDEISEKAMRVMMSCVIIKAINFSKQRKEAHPRILIVLDEALTAGLLSKSVCRALMETRKFELFFLVLTQTHSFPDGMEDVVLQACNRHVWGKCSDYSLARKGAMDLIGAEYSEEARDMRIAKRAAELMTLWPGHFWFREPEGIHREYIPMLEDPWPWPKTQAIKLDKKIRSIFDRQEYGKIEMTDSKPSSKKTRRRRTSSPADSSPARRLKNNSKQLTVEFPD